MAILGGQVTRQRVIADQMSCPHRQTTVSPTPEEVSAAIDDASVRIAAAGERMTGPRRRVLELLLTASAPVKAYDLIERFHEDGRVAMPATVYRALKFLEQMALLHRVSSLNSYVACTRAQHPHSPAFWLCRCCGASREMEVPVEGALIHEAAARGYSVTHVTFEVHGTCPACRHTIERAGS